MLSLLGVYPSVLVKPVTESIRPTGGIATGRTGGEENDNEETDDKDEGVEDDEAYYNTMVVMVIIMTTITITLLLACMSYVLRRE